MNGSVRRSLLVALPLLLIAGSAPAGVELILADGRTMRGESAEIRDDVFLVTDRDGDTFTVPAALVTEIRLGEDFEEKPTGIVRVGPRVLAGSTDPIETPGPSEQLEAFGRPPASFPASVVGTSWRPEDAFRGRESRFDPARWYEAPIDPVWTPRSAFRASEDVTEFNPARWFASPIDPTWIPSSGFGETRWFGGVVRGGRR